MRAQRATLTRIVQYVQSYTNTDSRDSGMHGQLLLNANVIHGVCTVSLSSLHVCFFCVLVVSVTVLQLVLNYLTLVTW